MTRPLPDVVAAYIDAYNARDVAGMLACLADDVAFRNISGGVETARADGKTAFAEMARFGAAAFSVRRQTVRAAITVADTTLVEIDYAATVAADLPNGWTAGQRLEVAGASLFRIRDGLIFAIVDES